MPGQSHRERDHYEHRIHMKADVEQAKSGFGGEAFLPLIDMRAGSDRFRSTFCFNVIEIGRTILMFFFFGFRLEKCCPISNQ